jgi:hypothetical protein
MLKKLVDEIRLTNWRFFNIQTIINGIHLRIKVRISSSVKSLKPTK